MLYVPAANVSRKLLIVIVDMATDIREQGRITSIVIANINCIKFGVFDEKQYCANAYATIDEAKLKIHTIANNLVFCAESFGTSVAYVLTTTVNKTAHIAIAT